MIESLCIYLKSQLVSFTIREIEVKKLRYNQTTHLFDLLALLVELEGTWDGDGFGSVIKVGGSITGLNNK